jgi:hypothetical protein
MIATSRKSTFPSLISRQFEFSRLQDQRLACAYEALIPVLPGRVERTEPRRSNAGISERGIGATRPSAMGA